MKIKLNETERKIIAVVLFLILYPLQWAGNVIVKVVNRRKQIL